MDFKIAYNNEIIAPKQTILKKKFVREISSFRRLPDRIRILQLNFPNFQNSLLPT